MKYRTRPFEIDAELFDGDNFGQIQAFVGKREAKDTPGYYIDNFDDVRNWWVDIEPGITAVVWDYLHSTWVGVRPGNYIIKGMKGEFYPCDAQVFEAKYEPIGGEAYELTVNQYERPVGIISTSTIGGGVFKPEQNKRFK